MADMVRTTVGLAVAAVAAGLIAGCGVKSAPRVPDNATYGQAYPAPDPARPAAAPAAVKKEKTTAPSAYGGGDYQPPKPATETLVQ